MARHTHLTHAPISEAIIEIRTNFEADKDIESLDLFPRISGHFNQKKPVFKQSGDIITQTDNEPDKTASLYGYRYSSDRKDFIIQSTRKGFTFSKLKPYSEWNDFLAAAKEYWAIFSDVAQPTSTSRVALRYINILDIPLPVDDLSSWLNFHPNLPDLADVGIVGFFSRTFAAIGSDQLIVTFALEPTTHEQKLPIIFDIDAFTPHVADIEDHSIWDSLERLRTVKNNVFFETITDQTLELYI